MQGIINSGTILIRADALLPETLQLDSEFCVPGWRLVKNLDGFGVERKLHEVGWTFFCLAGETSATVFGLDAEKMGFRAIERILANPRSKSFNSLEILRLALVPSKRFLGIHSLTAFAQSRHIQENPILFRTKNDVERERAQLAAA